MRPSVRRLEETYHSQVDFHILNVDFPATYDLAIQYQVPGIPLIVLLDAEGNEFSRLLGYYTEDQLIAAIAQLLEAHP